MVVPDNVVTAVYEGDVTTVVAWLDAGGDVNDISMNDEAPAGVYDTLLMSLVQSDDLTSRHVELAKLLLQRGADVNKVPDFDGDGASALHCIVDFQSYAGPDQVPILMEIMGLYIEAGANVNHKNWGGATPLGAALKFSNWYGQGQPRWVLAVATLLLRGGATLDAVTEEFPAEEILRRAEMTQETRNDEHYLACRALVADVRAAGSYNEYARAPSKALLRFRSLVARGHARERKARTRRKTPREVALLFAPTFPRELFWKVAGYWNPRPEALRKRHAPVADESVSPPGAPPTSPSTVT